MASRSSTSGSAAVISLLTVRTPTTDDYLAALPRSQTSFRVDQTFFVEVWASRPAAAAWGGDGLAAVFVDLSFDAAALAVERVISSNSMPTFAGGVIHPRLGLVSQLGGCSRLDSPDLGADGTWARVATLAVRAGATGPVTLTAGPSDPIHGVAIVNELGNLDPFRVDFGATVVNIVMRPTIHKVPRRLRDGTTR